jgi:hypothetical protein
MAAHYKEKIVPRANEELGEPDTEVVGVDAKNHLCKKYGSSNKYPKLLYK